MVSISGVVNHDFKELHMPKEKIEARRGEITEIGDNSVAVLKRTSERLDALEDQKADIAADIKDVWIEVKSAGFDVKVLRRLRALQKVSKDERDEMTTLVNLYANALGIGDLI